MEYKWCDHRGQFAALLVCVRCQKFRRCTFSKAEHQYLQEAPGVSKIWELKERKVKMYIGETKDGKLTKLGINPPEGEEAAKYARVYHVDKEFVPTVVLKPVTKEMKKKEPIHTEVVQMEAAKAKKKTAAKQGRA